MFLVDTAAGRIMRDDEDQGPRLRRRRTVTEEWLHGGPHAARRTAAHANTSSTRTTSVRRRQQGVRLYRRKSARFLIAPMAPQPATEPKSGRWGNGHADRGAVQATTSASTDYFTQMFAAGPRNPPTGLDPGRSSVTSMSNHDRPGSRTLLEPGPASCRQIVLAVPGDRPATTLAKIPVYRRRDGDIAPATRPSACPACTGSPMAGRGMRAPVDRDLPARVSEAGSQTGVRVLVLSDRDSTADLAPIPSLLLTAAIPPNIWVREAERRTQRRRSSSRPATAREIHHIATTDRIRPRRRSNPVPRVWRPSTTLIATGAPDRGGRPRRRQQQHRRPAWARASSRSCPRWASPR